MYRLASILLSVFLLACSVASSPLLSKRSEFTDAVAALKIHSPTDVSATVVGELGLRDAVRWARPAYCATVNRGSWSCGAYCNAIPDARILWRGGDSNAVPYAFVAYSASLSTLAVVHSGTNSSSILSILSDLNFGLEALDPRLSAISSATSRVRVHSGFQTAWQSTADAVLSAVRSALRGPAAGASKVLVTGHSLGAAISILEGLYLKSQLTGYDVQVVPIAPPRVGNGAFASWASGFYGNSLAWLVNENDIVPHLPPLALAYEHVDNQIWQRNDDNSTTGNARYCLDGESDDCSNSYLIAYNADRHYGPYVGMTIGGRQGCS